MTERVTVVKHPGLVACACMRPCDPRPDAQHVRANAAGGLWLISTFGLTAPWTEAELSILESPLHSHVREWTNNYWVINRAWTDKDAHGSEFTRYVARRQSWRMGGQWADSPEDMAACLDATWGCTECHGDTSGLDLPTIEKAEAETSEYQRTPGPHWLVVTLVADDLRSLVTPEALSMADDAAEGRGWTPTPWAHHGYLSHRAHHRDGRHRRSFTYHSSHIEPR